MIHAQKLERWLGPEQIATITTGMAGGGPHGAPRWYGPDIAVSRVPGRVFATRDGDFRGRLADGGRFSNLLDHSVERVRTAFRRSEARRKWRENRGHFTSHAGFTSLSDLIAEGTAGKRVRFSWQKAGATGVVAVTNSLWGLGAMPAAGANASNAPGGDAPTDATTGAVPYTNPTGGDTLHFTTGYPNASVVGNTLLLYDRIFQVNKTMASTATEAVTGVPTRYQSTTGGAVDSAEGNFLFVEVGGTALAATAHNWTVCQYTDQSGNATITLPSLTGNSGAIVRRLDHPVGQWFAPLATGDTGIQKLTQMQCSASVATGVINFVIGHPIAWMPCPVANMVCVADGVNSAFNLDRIFDDAALALLEVTKPSTTATNYNLDVLAVYG